MSDVPRIPPSYPPLCKIASSQVLNGRWYLVSSALVVGGRSEQPRWESLPAAIDPGFEIVATVRQPPNCENSTQFSTLHDS